MSENIKIGYIIHFCNHSHEQINDAYEAMCDENEEHVVKILSDLKKFINETIRDYQSEIDARKAAVYDASHVCSDDCGCDRPCNPG